MRQLPEYVQQLGIGSLRQVSVSTAPAQLTGQVSDSMARLAQQGQQQAERIAEIRTSTQIRERVAELGRQFEADPQGFEASVSALRAGWKKDMTDPLMAEKIDSEISSVSMPYLNRAYEKYRSNQNSDHMVAVTEASLNIYNDLGTIAKNAFSPIPEERSAAQNEMRERLARLHDYAQEKAADGTYLLNPQQQMNIIQNGTQAIISGLKPEQQLEVISPSGGFERSIGIVMQNEGGLAEVDGASGAPAIYGINRKWHEKAFDEAERITAEQGEAAGRAYAAQFYKREYWDKNNIDSLRPDQQAIVFDGAINHTPTFAKKLIEAAKEGASPSQLLDMRQQEYDRLYKANPKAYGQSIQGWSNRLSNFSHYTLNESLAYLDPKGRASIERAAREEVQKDRTLMINDYGAWGAKHGYTPEQLTAMSSNPRTASVIPNDTAKQMVARIQQADNFETFTQTALSLKQQMGGAYKNAMLDLQRHGLSGAHESAMVIMQEAPQYSEQAKDLFTFAQTGESIIDAQMKDAGMKPDDIRAKAVSRFVDEGYSDVAYNEVPRVNAARYVEDKKEAAVALAKVYMFRNPSASVDDALDYAFQIENERYAIGDVYGSKIRIPKQAVNIPDMDARLELFIDDIAESQKGRGVLSKNITPVLNESEDGYFFLDANKQVFVRDGKPLTLSFDDLRTYRTPYTQREIKQAIPEMSRELDKLIPKKKPKRRTTEELTD